MTEYDSIHHAIIIGPGNGIKRFSTVLSHQEWAVINGALLRMQSEERQRTEIVSS